MERLLAVGFMHQVTEPDTSGSVSLLVTGYVLTAEVKEALNRDRIA